MIFLLSVSLLIMSTTGAEIFTSNLNESSNNEANMLPPSPITVIRHNTTTVLHDSAKQNVSANGNDVHGRDSAIPAEVITKPSDVPTAEDNQPVNNIDSTNNRRMSYIPIPKLILKPKDRPNGLICLSPASIKNIRIILMYILQNQEYDFDISTIKAMLSLLVDLRNQLLSVPTSTDVVDVLQKLYILENHLLLVVLKKKQYVIPAPAPAPEPVHVPLPVPVPASNEIVNNLVTIKYSYPALNKNCRLAFEKLTKFVANAYRYLAKNPICGGNTGVIPQILPPQNNFVLNDQNSIFSSHNHYGNPQNGPINPYGNNGVQSTNDNNAMNSLNVLPLDPVLDDKPPIILPSLNNDDQFQDVEYDTKKNYIVKGEPTNSAYTLNDIISGGYPLQLGPHYVPQQRFYPQKNVGQNEHEIHNPYGNPILLNSLPNFHEAQTGSSISDGVINTPRPTPIEVDFQKPIENDLLQKTTVVNDVKNPGKGLNDLLERLTAATIKHNADAKNKWISSNFETEVSNNHINEPPFKIKTNGNGLPYNSYGLPLSLTHVSPNINDVKADAIKLAIADNDNLIKINNPSASNNISPEPVWGLKSNGNNQQYEPPKNIPITYYDAKGDDIFEALNDDAVKASIADNNKSVKYFPIPSINDTPQPFDTEFNGYNQLYNQYTAPNPVNYIPIRNNILGKIKAAPYITGKDKLITPFKIMNESPGWETDLIKNVNNPYGQNLEYYNPYQNDIKLPYYDYTVPNIITNPYQNDIVSNIDSNTLPFSPIKQLLPDFTNKLLGPSMNSKIVELTYVLKPNTLLYTPMYVVKYRLPYEKFVQKSGKLLKDKPLLRSAPSEVYKELIADANVTKITPDLKPEERDNVISLVSDSGTLVDFKIVNGDEEESISKYNITSSEPLLLPKPQLELPTSEIQMHPHYFQMPPNSAVSQQKSTQDLQAQPQFSAEILKIPNQASEIPPDRIINMPSQIVWDSTTNLVKALDPSISQPELIHMLSQEVRASPQTLEAETRILPIPPEDLKMETQVKQGIPNGVQMQTKPGQIQNQDVQFPLQTSETSYHPSSVPKVDDTKSIFQQSKLDLDNERKSQNQANFLDPDKRMGNESTNSFDSHNIEPSNATSVAAVATANVSSTEKPIPKLTYYRYDEDLKVFKPVSLPSYDG